MYIFACKTMSPKKAAISVGISRVLKVHFNEYSMKTVVYDMACVTTK